MTNGINSEPNGLNYDGALWLLRSFRQAAVIFRIPDLFGYICLAFFSFSALAWQGDIRALNSNRLDWEPYICNAGIQHDSGLVKVCRQTDGQLPCLSDSVHCQCQYQQMSDHLDFFRYARFSDSGALSGHSVFVKDGRLQKIFDEDSSENQPIYGVSYHLDSRATGTKFFWDICLPATYLYPGRDNGTLETTGLLKTSSESVQLPGYLKSAGLEVNIEVIKGDCEQDHDYKGPWQNEAIFENKLSQYPDESCVLRYSFEETLAFERLWSQIELSFDLTMKFKESRCVQDVAYWQQQSRRNYSGRDRDTRISWHILDDEYGEISFDQSSAWDQMMKERPPHLSRWQESYQDLAEQWMAATLNYYAGARYFDPDEIHQQAAGILRLYGSKVDDPEFTGFPEQSAKDLGKQLQKYNQGDWDVRSCDP